MSEIKQNTPKKKKKSSRMWLWIIIIAVVWWFNNYTLKVNRVSLKSEKIGSALRIAVVSDLHAAKLGIGNAALFKAVDDAKADVVFFLGDMYTSGSSLMDRPVELAEMLTSAGYPVYAVTGEHDTDSSYIEALENTGVHVMDYKSEYIDVKGNILHIMGIDNVYYSPTFDLRNEFSVNEDCFNILLAHIPNYEKFSLFGADLTLCGDTHGEMAQLPFGKGPLYHSGTQTWFPELLHKELEIYDKGFFDYDGGSMFITSGIGVYPVPVRFNNRPEVVIMDIEPKR